MEPLNLMVSLSFFGNKRDRADNASNGARRTAEPAPASTRARRIGDARTAPASTCAQRTGGARRAVRWLRTVGAR